MSRWKLYRIPAMRAFLGLLTRIWTAKRKIWRSLFVLLIHTKQNWQGDIENILLSIHQNSLCSAIRICHQITKGSKLASKLT